MRDKPKVLLIEDSQSIAAIYHAYLKNESIQLLHALTGKDAIALIDKESPDLILLDLKLPDMSGEDILKWMNKQDIPASVIVITAHGSVDIAVDVMRLGANDFLQKPIEASRLKTTLRNALEKQRLKHIVENFADTFERKNYHGFIGSSLPMQAAYQIIDSAAPSRATIFITGESGTGKEVCAEAIHKQSQCKKGPFIAINCGAIPTDLMESEIFGHVKGAFTGAATERSGAASLADNGTLFLDEIGEMSMELQTKLLRFIQSGIIKKVGGSKEEQVNVRFICATNRDPLDEVKAGRFREDLYYRLNVVPLHLPPLRDRGDDILLLATNFLKLYSKEDNKSFQEFSAEVEYVLRHYHWPGNVRQLQNVIRNIVVLHNDTIVTPKHLPPPLNSIAPNTSSISSHHNMAHQNAAHQNNEQHAHNNAENNLVNNTQIVTHHIEALSIVEKRTIENAIAFCDGNIPKAAALLDVSPSTIYRKKQAWE